MSGFKPPPFSVNDIIKLTVAGTLALCILMIVGALVFGLFTDKVDNADIFKILGSFFSIAAVTFVSIIKEKK